MTHISFFIILNIDKLNSHVRCRVWYFGNYNYKKLGILLTFAIGDTQQHIDVKF